jgi:Na+/proline symporter
MNTILIGLSIYILVQFAIGLLAVRHSENETDFILAGRGLGPLLGSFTVFATWFGAESVIGAAGNIYENGLSGSSSDPFGWGLCLILMGCVYAVPLWKRNYTTFGDFFRERYSSQIEKFFVLLVVPSSIFWSAAQIRAFGQIVSVISDVDVEMAISGAAVLIIVYTMIGGMRATAVTDLIQGIALVVGLIVLFIFVINAAGGIGPSIEQVPLERIKLNTEVSLLSIIEKWAVPICGATLAAESIARILATRSENTARFSAVSGGVLYIVVGMIPLYIGLVGPELIPELEDSEQIIPSLAKEHLSTFFYILFCGALVSVILSTVDSAVLAAASLISHNVVVPLKKEISDKSKVTVVRVSIVVIGLIAYYFAINAEGVYELIYTAVSFGTAGVFVVGTLGLFTRIGKQYSAYAGFIAGSALWVIGEYLTSWETPYLVALFGATVLYLLIAFVESRMKKVI